MNTDHLGRWSVAARNHPGDGRVEIIEVAASMSWRQRFTARRRLPAGTFLPHPDIGTRSVPSAVWSFERPMHVVVDGRSVGSTRHLRVTVEPDAFELHA
jgi:diacylglycerol kinase family enzyme